MLTIYFIISEICDYFFFRKRLSNILNIVIDKNSHLVQSVYPLRYLKTDLPRNSLKRNRKCNLDVCVFICNNVYIEWITRKIVGQRYSQANRFIGKGSQLKYFNNLVYRLGGPWQCWSKAFNIVYMHLLRGILVMLMRLTAADLANVPIIEPSRRLI